MFLHMPTLLLRWIPATLTCMPPPLLLLLLLLPPHAPVHADAAAALDANVPDATAAAAGAAVSLQEGLPSYKVGLVTPKKVTVVLHAGEAPIKFFHSLKGAQLRISDVSIPRAQLCVRRCQHSLIP
jgi:hypothetical protein